MNQIKLLMCYGNLSYTEEYGKINAWMDKRHSIDTFEVERVWEKVCKYAQFCGAEVKLISPQEAFPDMFFTRNAGLVIPGDKPRVILSSFKHKERQGERYFYRQWFEQNGFEVIVLPMGVIFEGGGEAIFWRNKLFFGHGFRAPLDTSTHLQYALESALVYADVVPLKLTDERFYHLDTALMPICGDGKNTSDVLVYYPKAFDEKAQKIIAALQIDRIEVTEKDACMFGCNLLALNNNIILAKGTTKLFYALQNRGFVVCELDMEQIKKGGGSVYCMTLNL